MVVSAAELSFTMLAVFVFAFILFERFAVGILHHFSAPLKSSLVNPRFSSEHSSHYRGARPLSVLACSAVLP